MKTYIIDGNNLIGKIKSLHIIHQKDKQVSREKLTFLLERFFKDKKAKVYLHFDGFENEKLSLSRGKIIYSEKQKADDKIKMQIEDSENRKNLIVISSDNGITDFARICGCEIIPSENFEKIVNDNDNDNEEKSKQDSISDDEIKKMFGL